MGRRQTLTRANGSSTTYGYDAIGRLNDLQLNSGGTRANEYTFAYTPADQISQKTLSNPAFSLTGASPVNRNYTPNGLNQCGNLRHRLDQLRSQGQPDQCGGIDLRL